MPTLTIVIGLPGSGKSHHARNLNRVGNSKVIEDALHPNKDNPIDAIATALDNGDCIIDSVKLIHPQARVEFKKTLKDRVPGIVLKWICFPNDPIVCIQNIIHDLPKRGCPNTLERIETVIKATKHYRLPNGADVLSIHKVFELGDSAT